MKTKLPSFFICFLLLPCAYLYAGCGAALKKQIVFGRRFFLEVLESKKKMGRVFSKYSRWKALPASFLFYSAAYIYRHGGLAPASVNALKKMIEYGPAGIWRFAAVEMRRLTLDSSKVYLRVLLIVGEETHHLPALLSFLKLLAQAGYELEVFAQPNSTPVQMLRALRQAGVRRVFSRNMDATPIDFLYEEGDVYRNIVLLPDSLTHTLVDCMRCVIPHGNMLCACGDSSAVRGVDPRLLEKLDGIVCRASTFAPRNVNVSLLPAIDENGDQAETLEEIIPFMESCGLLPLAWIVRHYAQNSLPEIPVSENSTVSFCLQTGDDEDLEKASLGLLLEQNVASGTDCEIVFCGKNAPQWAQSLPVPWSYVETDAHASLKTFQILGKACRGEFIFFLQASKLLIAGLSQMLALMRASPEVVVCGCRMLGHANTILEAGAYEAEGRVIPLGSGTPANAPFYRATRSVPLVSAAACMVRKSDLVFTGQAEPIRFVDVYDGYMGFLPDSGKLAVVCGEAEVFFSNADTQAITEEQEPDHAAEDKTAILIAAQDRYVPPSAKARSKEHINILYYSPYQSHPASHGNRSTIQYFGKILREKGCTVHFALLGLDRYEPEDLKAMRKAWDSLTILPYPFQDNSYRGEDIPFDEWYEPGLGEHIAYLCSLYDIDLLFCSYVFQSKMLEFVPDHILKVIDTHDKMSGRYAAQKARGLKTEFFSCTPEDEGRYLRRADVVVARRAEEAEYFNGASGKETAIVPPHVEPPHFMGRRFDTLADVGLVASANIINLGLVTDFLLALSSMTGNAPPVSVRVAGQVQTMLDQVPREKRWVFNEPWVNMLGFVENIEDFYTSVDLIVSPVMYGTGINVKTVQAMSFGMPLITTACGCKGIETGHELHSLTTMEEVVAGLLALKKHPEELQALANRSRERYTNFYRSSLDGFDSLLDACIAKRA